MKKRNLALVELTLVILFMALSAAVLVQVFAAARVTSDESRAQTLGQAMAQDIIERWKAGEAPDSLFAASGGWSALPENERGEFPLRLAADGGAGPDPDVAVTAAYVLWLDKDLAPAAGGESAYYFEVTLGTQPQPAGTLREIAVRMIADHTGHELVGFVTAQYEPG